MNEKYIAIAGIGIGTGAIFLTAAVYGINSGLQAGCMGILGALVGALGGATITAKKLKTKLD